MSNETVPSRKFQKYRRASSWVFLVLLLFLLGWAAVDYNTPGEYGYHRLSSFVVPLMLLLNHLAFNIVKKRPWDIVLGIIAIAFVVFGCYITFSGR